MKPTGLIILSFVCAISVSAMSIYNAEKNAMPFPMSNEDKVERIEGAISNFRNGYIGPVTFRATLGALGINATEIEEMQKAHYDEWKRNARVDGTRKPPEF